MLTVRTFKEDRRRVSFAHKERKQPPDVFCKKFLKNSQENTVPESVF